MTCEGNGNEPAERRDPFFELTLLIEVEDEGRIVSTNAAARREGFEAGASLLRESPLATTLHALFVEARTREVTMPRSFRDVVTDRHWLLFAGRVHDERGARMRLRGIDATLAVVSERRATVPNLLHELRNVMFGFQSVVDALLFEPEAKEELSEFTRHLRKPVERLQLLIAELHKLRPTR